MTPDATPAELGAGWARLTAGVADRVLLATVRDMHRTISDGGFRRVGPVGRGVQAVHDRVTDGVYSLVGASLRGLGAGAATLVERRARHTPRPVAAPPDGPPGAAPRARAIAHGVLQADLLALAPAFDQELTLRLRGRRVDTTADALRAAYPQATGRVVVFVHGLVDTEFVWAGGGSARRSLPSVAAASGHTPVLVRYGTGRSVAANGRALARMLAELTERWPVEITHLTLVGHSMGGLVIRSALSAAQQAGWIRTVSDVVHLGTPHLGSWLEKVANTASWTLRLHSHSAPIGRLIDMRSRGIKDLRFGALDETAWSGTGIDDLLTGRTAPVVFGTGMRHHLVVGGLGRSDRNAVRFAVGDALVRTASARATGRSGSVGSPEGVRVLRVHGVSHAGLVQDPAVADVLAGLLPP